MTPEDSMRLWRKSAVAIAWGVVAAFAAAANAQGTWPAKPVKIISVFPPGGSVDQVARIFAQQLTVQTGQQFIVDNRGGASGSIGTQVVATAPPDGYTFGVVFDTHAVNPSLIPNIAYDTLKDLAPVMLVGTSPMAIVAHVGQPYKDFRDVIAAAKTKSGSVAIGSIGTGSLGHLAIAQIGKLSQVEFIHIPYRGGGPLMTDAIGGAGAPAVGRGGEGKRHQSRRLIQPGSDPSLTPVVRPRWLAEAYKACHCIANAHSFAQLEAARDRVDAREYARVVARSPVADARGVARHRTRGHAALLEPRQARESRSVLAAARIVEERREYVDIEEAVRMPAHERAVRAGDEDRAPVLGPREGDRIGRPHLAVPGVGDPQAGLADLGNVPMRLLGA